MIDSEQYQSLCEALGTRFDTALNLFDDQSRKRLQALHQAHQEDDRQQMREILHQIKGGAQSFGALQLVNICDRLRHQLHEDGSPLPNLDALESCLLNSLHQLQTLEPRP